MFEREQSDENRTSYRKQVYFIMKKFIMSVANVRGYKNNTDYPNQVEVSSLDDLKKAAQFDHIAGQYEYNHRADENFISTDCVFMDCDNDGSENPNDWLTPEKLSERLPEVEFYIVYSKSNMKTKRNGKTNHYYSERPRFHVYFTLSETVDKAARIKELKNKLFFLVPEFDKGALDVSRQLFGVQEPNGECFEGSLCIDEFIDIHCVDTFDIDDSTNNNMNEDTVNNTDGEILLGTRNDTIFKVALNALKNYSEKKARQLFDAACERCNPPLSIQECNRTWQSALGYRNEFKAKYKEKKKVLTLQVLEKTLETFRISVRFNVIAKDIEVSDLPLDSHYIPQAYYSLNAYAKKSANKDILPLFLTSYLKDKGYSFSENFLLDSLNVIAITHPFNPVLNMILSREYDGIDRLAELDKALGIEGNKHQQFFLRKWLHQAVALALNEDGSINPEFVLTLQGAQGEGKTSVFRQLAGNPEFFAEGLSIDVQNKDSLIQSTCIWIAEIGELDGTTKKQQANLKSFLTQSFDTYRKPYGRRHEKTPRRTCFCATVNPDKVLRDDTGNRRFVIIHVEHIDKDFVFNHMTAEWTQQLWRQVYETLYKANGKKGFYLTDEEREYSENANQEFQVPLKAEIELYDLLNWQADVSQWRWWSITELKTSSKALERYDAAQIGKVIKKIMSKDKRVKKHSDKVQGITTRLNWLPPKHESTYSHEDIPAPTVEQPQEIDHTRYNQLQVEYLLQTPESELTENQRKPYYFYKTAIQIYMQKHLGSLYCEALPAVVRLYGDKCEYDGLNWPNSETIPEPETLKI